MSLQRALRTHVVGLLGNTLVIIFVILCDAKVKTATNIYLLNLAITDELCMLSVLFVASSAALHHWPFGSVLCCAVLSVDGLNMFTSVFCLMVLSVDRYVAVVHPLCAATCRRPRMAKLINLGMWLASLLVTLPLAIFANTRPAWGGQAMACNLHWPHPAWSAAFVMWAVALRANWQQWRHLEKKITRLVLTVVSIFVLCWMPFYMVQLLNLFVTSLDATVNHVSLILGYANSCVNPILYSFLSDNFHCSFQHVLCLRCCLLGAAGWAEEEPLDYYVPRLSRAEARQDAYAHRSPASRRQCNRKPPAITYPSLGPPPSEEPFHHPQPGTPLQPSRLPVWLP
ncbi:Somatostatin Receptor Type 4 [Manis pentadactyla]|nr:Somatostatin Receptor Type 4 [Manis pentadactyla]